MTSTVLLEVSDHVAVVTLNRPHRRNAISWNLVVDLARTLESCHQRDDVRVIVLRGAGGDFCVGADMARVGSTDTQAQETRTLRGRSHEDDLDRLTQASQVAELLVRSPVPTIAAVEGACAGAGLSLALAADLRIASDRAVFNTAFISAGVPGDLGSAWLLTRAAGPARARALLLDPVKITAHRAAELGLVSEVCEDLPARVTALASKLAAQAPLAMAGARRNLDDADSLSFTDYLRREIPRMVDCARSLDARRAAEAFMEKRSPTFTGE